MASSENSQNWRKKETNNVDESKSERENCKRSGINGNWRNRTEENWRTEGEEHWRSGSHENWRTRQNENWRKEGKSESSSLEEECHETQIHGCWKILCEKTREYEEVWKSAMELHTEQPWLFPVTPRRWFYNMYHDTEFIECFTSSVNDKEDIKKAAEYIREKVSFPFIMHYIEAPVLPKKFHKYMHTPDSEFYELEGTTWKIALKESLSGDSRKEDLSSEVWTVEKSRLVEIKSSRALAINDIQSASSSYEIVLPSEVTDEDYIYFPPTEEAIEKMRLTKGGKWMVYTGYDMSKHDDIWTALIPLCIEGISVGLKASTAVITEAEQYMGGGVIHCYTANSDDAKDVKKVVDKIRSVLSYNYVLNYKTNYSSAAGQYAKEGCFSVSQYMDTVKGTFYKRDRYGRFSLEGLLN